MKLAFKKLNPSAILPRYAHEGDSGMDLFALEDGYIEPYSSRAFRTGVAADTPHGYELQVRPRSGLTFRDDIVCVLGTIDSGYRGDIGVKLFNFSRFPFDVKAGDRIAQLVCAPVVRAEIEETDTLSDSSRGTRVFGSTGV